MLTYEEALARISALEVAVRTEELPLAQAAGRVAAGEVRLDRDQPGFDRATMDGYALRLAGDADRFEVVGTVLAGTSFDGALAPGQAVRIMTGAPCPADVTVVPIEKTDGGEQTVQVTDAAALEPGRNIAWRGEDGFAGEVILAAGTRLGPANLSAVAMAGRERVAVFANPRVGIVTTGDEVGRAGAAGIRDSNGPLLEALLGSLGCPLERCHARDEEGELEARLGEAAERCDVVVTVGGVSMGARDLIPATAAKLGFEQVFHRVAVQPGKPILVCRRPDGRLLVGLPGNPVSVLATAHLFLARAIGRFWGGWCPEWLDLPIAGGYEQRGRRHLFLPARLGAGGVTPVRWNGSGDLLAAASADGLVELRAGSSFAAGDPIPFLPYLGHDPGQRGVLPKRERER